MELLIALRAKRLISETLGQNKNITMLQRELKEELQAEKKGGGRTVDDILGKKNRANKFLVKISAP